MKSKKVAVIAAVSLAILLVSATVGTVLAQEPVRENPPPVKKLFTRVAQILGIEEQQLIDAFAQARRELAQDAFNKRLDKLVEERRLTQQQADEIRAWWAQRPECLGPGWSLCRPGPRLDSNSK